MKTTGQPPSPARAFAFGFMDAVSDFTLPALFALFIYVGWVSADTATVVIGVLAYTEARKALRLAGRARTT